MITWICVVDKCNLNICVTFRNVLENQTKISCNIFPRTKASKINLLENTLFNVITASNLFTTNLSRSLRIS